MNAVLSSLFLVAGSGLCLLAAIGVLRLPDFFMRMHASTKAGVAGTGLILIGVGFSDPSLGLWVKIALAVTFLLLTTPIAGHLLARAGYVAGVPLWSGTSIDQLSDTLPRGDFDRTTRHPAKATDQRSLRDHGRGLTAVHVAITSGHDIEEVIRQAVAIAQARGVPLVGLAIIDATTVGHVGPVPLGGAHYAANLRNSQFEKARRRLGMSVQMFESIAKTSGCSYSVRVEEGDAVEILRDARRPDGLLMVSRSNWFDHGVAEGVHDPMRRLVRNGIHPLIGVERCCADVRKIVFVHDGSPHSDRTLDWLLEVDPWPDAGIDVVPDEGTSLRDLESVRQKIDAGKRFRIPAEGVLARPEPDVLVFGNEGHEGWINRLRSGSRPSLEGTPVVIFG